MFADYDLKVILCTPTATPLPWLVDERPEILQTNPTKRRGTSALDDTTVSTRHSTEPRHRIVSAMAAHYADTSAVLGWQTDNKFGCHGTVRCYCENCSAAFSESLAEKYANITELNE